MKLGAHFKRQRMAKGLSEAQVARLIRPDFEASLLWDFESGDDNDIDGWSIAEFKRYCEVLAVDPTDFADIPTSDMTEASLPNLVKKRREEKAFTVSDLADRIGYDPAVIEAIEGQREDMVVCLDVLRQVAAELDIPFRLLLEKI